MKDSHVVDSSVWIEVERKNTAVLHIVEPLIARNAVCLVDVIAVELLRGTRSRNDFLRLKRALADFTHLTAAWQEVVELAFIVARAGYAPPLIDLYIAQCVVEHKKVIVTQDDHFRQIARVKPFEVLFLSK